ncbi:MAG: bacillithiol biosynthesis deacetylase BshB1 [Gemmatimonadota bacterium]
MNSPTTSVDVLAIGAHCDDVELVCGGTLIRCADQGYRTGVIDLTRGEVGTKGSAEIRAAEAARAAELMGLSVRLNAGFSDAGIFNTPEARERLAEMIRQLTPRVVILPFPRGRHPDHRITAELGRDASYLAGLQRYGRGPAHRPHKVLYAMAFREDAIKPTFVVNIEEQFERKMRAIRCYASQFDAATSAGEAYPTGQPLYELVEAQSRHYGSLIRAGFGEPFYTEETMEAVDIVRLGVRSM